MARTDTLGNFLTDIAEAIRTVDGTTDVITASEFDTRISSLSTGFSEDLTEELANYDTELTEQETTIDDIISALNTKSAYEKTLYTPRYFSASGSFSELDYEMANIDVVNATSLSYAFNAMSTLTRLDLNHWNTSNITNLGNVFNNCTSLGTVKVSNWDTSNVTSMYGTFYNCKSLTSLDLSNWTTTNVTAMGSMFYNCTSLQHLDIRNFNFDNINTTAKRNNMFYNVPTDCEIIVGTSGAKSWLKSYFGAYENVKTVEEYEAELEVS